MTWRQSPRSQLPSLPGVSQLPLGEEGCRHLPARSAHSDAEVRTAVFSAPAPAPTFLVFVVAERRERQQNWLCHMHVDKRDRTRCDDEGSSGVDAGRCCFTSLLGAAPALRQAGARRDNDAVMLTDGTPEASRRSCSGTAWSFLATALFSVTMQSPSSPVNSTSPLRKRRCCVVSHRLRFHRAYRAIQCAESAGPSLTAVINVKSLKRNWPTHSLLCGDGHESGGTSMLEKKPCDASRFIVFARVYVHEAPHRLFA